MGLITLILIAMGMWQLWNYTHPSRIASTMPATTTYPSLKPQGAGLYTNGFNNSTIHHVYLNLSWKDLEPTPGVYDWQSIDTQLQSHPNTKFRLRFESGVTWGRSGWICQSDKAGPCITIHHNKTDSDGYVPKFWTDAYLNSFRDFAQAAAEHFDKNPQVLDVVNGACMTFTAEPFILGGSGSGSAADVLYKSGLTNNLDANCISRSTADLVNAFMHTRITLATFEGMQEASGVSWPDEHAVLQDLHTKYGSHVSFQNNGFTQAVNCSQQNVTPANASTVWCYMKSVGPPIGFQQGCGSKGTACEQPALIENAIAMGGCYLEHNNWNGLGSSEADFDKRLKQVPGCS